MELERNQREQMTRASAKSLLLGLGIVCVVGLEAGCSKYATVPVPSIPVPFEEEVNPDVSPDGSRLVFVYSSQSAYQTLQIWTFDLRDSTLEQVGVGEYPAWSHDGRLIAYTSSSQLVVYDVNARTTSPVWNGGPFARPTWAPGDQWIAVDRFFSDSLNGVWAHAVGSDSVRRLLPAGLRLPAWSPDSAKLVVEVPEPSHEIAVASVATGVVDTLTHDGRDDRSPAWSRDGQWIAWNSNSPGSRPHIWIMRADGSEKRDLGVEGIYPCWSLDGTSLYFSGYYPNERAYLLTRVLRDGSGWTRLLGFWHGHG